MARYRYVEQNLELIRRSRSWNPRLQRILKAAPLVVFFLLLNARTARSATCSFNPAPDPTVDGSPTSLRHAIQAANASGQDCLITLAKGTYTLTIKNTNGHENDAAQGDLDIGDSGHTVTIQGQGAASSIVNGNKIDRVFDVLSGADAVFQNLTIEGGIAQDDGTAGALPGTTAALGGGILVQGTGQASLEGVTLKGNLALGGNGAKGGGGRVPRPRGKWSTGGWRGPLFFRIHRFVQLHGLWECRERRCWREWWRRHLRPPLWAGWVWRTRGNGSRRWTLCPPWERQFVSVHSVREQRDRRSRRERWS